DRGHQVAERYPAALLHVDDPTPKLLALALVRAKVFDVVDRQFLHGHPSSSSIPYARASTCNGCTGRFPVASSIAPFARWQSPATNCASLSAIRSISGFAIRFARSTFSARSPHVPSIALHRSTTSTCAPVSAITSRLFGPICCARE